MNKYKLNVYNKAKPPTAIPKQDMIKTRPIQQGNADEIGYKQGDKQLLRDPSNPADHQPVNIVLTSLLL